MAEMKPVIQDGRIAALEAELAAAKQDTERLDWLADNHGETSAEQIEDDPEDEDSDTHDGWAVYGVVYFADRGHVASATADTLREAIDAAMLAARAPEGTEGKDDDGEA